MREGLKSIYYVYLAAAVLLIGLLSGCSSRTIEAKKETSGPGYSSITPEEARKRLEKEEGIILLDVRTKEEYDAGHIRDALLIPVDTLESEAEKSLKDKDSVIFVYCRSGNRSKTAADILASLGYKNIYDLGGIKDWPYEIVK